MTSSFESSIYLPWTNDDDNNNNNRISAIWHFFESLGYLIQINCNNNNNNIDHRSSLMVNQSELLCSAWPMRVWSCNKPLNQFGKKKVYFILSYLLPDYLLIWHHRGFVNFVKKINIHFHHFLMWPSISLRVCVCYPLAAALCFGYPNLFSG